MTIPMELIDIMPWKIIQQYCFIDIPSYFGHINLVATFLQFKCYDPLHMYRLHPVLVSKENHPF